MEDKVCKNCKYYVEKIKNFGECRRSPNIAYKKPSDWCGEFVKRSEGEKLVE